MGQNTSAPEAWGGPSRLHGAGALCAPRRHATDVERESRSRGAAGCEGASPEGWIAPATPIENTLARLWSEVLDIDMVSRDDNFFELGGHSLLVVTLLEQMRRAGFAADVRTVFSKPVLSAMAAAITVGAGNEAPGETPSDGIPADCTRIEPGMLPLAGLTQREIDAVCAAVPGGVANIQDIYRLLPQQEGILFHHRLAGNDRPDVYQVRWVMAIDGRERFDRVLAALQVIIDRHDALRTLVLWEGLPHPVQVVCRRVQMVVNEIDDLGGRRAIEYLTDRTDRRCMRLVLSEAPLLTAFAARDLDRDEWHLAIVVHHIVVDHVSLGILASKLQRLVRGESGALPAPRPFFTAGATDSEAFFREMLGDVDQPTLPFDFANVQGDGSQVVEAVRRVPEDLSSRIRAAATRHQVSPAVLFHVAWAMVVARCSGCSDVVFGTVLYGRSEGLSGLKTTMGMLINTLPIRVNFAEARPVEVVKVTYQRLSELMRHEHAPLALAQRCSRVAATVPLFSALLNYRHIAVDWGSSDGDGYTLEGVRTELGEQRTNYPFMMAVDDLGDQFVLTSQCEPSVDPERAVDLLATALQGLSGALLDDRPSDAAETRPSCSDLILKLSLLTPAERLRVTREFNATSQQINSTPAFVQFERQAARTPSASAVAFEGELLSYEALNARANRLAHHLRHVGVVPGVNVGLCLERSPDLVVAVLGIHKAGGTFVPLDPGFPTERLSFMLSDSEAAVLLTAGDCARGIEVPDVVHVLDLDAEADVLVSLSDENLESGVQGRDIAYVIYTSGSTGRPKGVAVSHLSLANFLWSMRHEPGLAAADTVAAVTTISFDIALPDIFLPLVVGARIELMSRQTATDGAALAQRLGASGATVLQATPATWRLLVEAGWKAGGGFRALCGGESLPHDLASALLDRVDELWNQDWRRRARRCGW